MSVWNFMKFHRYPFVLKDTFCILYQHPSRGSNMFWVKKNWSQNSWDTNVFGGSTMLGVKFDWGAETEQSECAMGKQEPPLAYAI